MNLQMGPVLLFRGLDPKRLRLCALTAGQGSDAPGELLTGAGARFESEPILTYGDSTLWRTEFDVPSNRGPVQYCIAGREFRVVPPPPTGARMLFVSCNGSEEPAELPAVPAERLRPWQRIAQSHARAPFHLMLQGGDQIYADQVWFCHPRLAPLKDRRYLARDTPFTQEMAHAVYDHYVTRYLSAWNEPEVAPLLAAVPSLMMWDDHDIIDGWGSWPPSLQQSPVFRGLYRAARETFAAFQLGLRNDENPLPPPFLDPTGANLSWFLRMGELALYAPDLRSERTQTAMLGAAGWTGLQDALRQARGCRYLFVVSSVPVLNSPMRSLERLHFAVPGHQFFQDDLRDQWQSYEHASEWERLIGVLLDFKRDTGARIVVLSGEIHFAAFGRLEAPEGPMVQLTSSGVVHPAPPSLVGTLMGLLGWPTWRIGDRARFRMLPIPGLGKRYLADRNWLIVQPARSSHDYEAFWCTETRGSSDAIRLD